VFFLFKMFNFDLPVLAAVVVIIVNYLALLVPITPGNLGSFQLGVPVSYILGKTGAVCSRSFFIWLTCCRCWCWQFLPLPKISPYQSVAMAEVDAIVAGKS
jgi:hypothetical protein